MKAPPENQSLKIAPQSFKNGEIHDWYRTVWGYSDHLVADLLDEFAEHSGRRVLDPFCGSGTTLVECMKRGLDCGGIDANPASCFITKTKTTWSLDPLRLIDLVESVTAGNDVRLRNNAYIGDPTYKYLDSTGMLERGWICEEPLKKAICLKHAIRQLNTNWRYKNLLFLALLNTVVRTAANVRFGPELYCIKPKSNVDVFGDFEMHVRKWLRTSRPHHCDVVRHRWFRGTRENAKRC